jgi:hypothetical protein
MPATVGGGWLIAAAGLAHGHSLAAGGLSHGADGPLHQTSGRAGHGNEPGKRRGPAGRRWQTLCIDTAGCR